MVDVPWLTDRLASGRPPVLADVRWYLDGRSGRDAHERGHLPGAVFVDLDRALAAEPGPAVGRHPLPAPEAFAAAMSALGIGDGTTVVAYDDAGGVVAARLVWMLRATGHDAALLDGGLAAWTGTLETGPATTEPAHLTPRPWPDELLADVDATADAASRGTAVVIDARDDDRYRGDREPVDPRAGHIPGAYNVPVRGNVLPDGTLLPVPVLRERFAQAGITDAADVISYCGSGVNACHNLLALEHAGLGVGRLFPGSWSQYSSDPARPAATGDAPG